MQDDADADARIQELGEQLKDQATRARRDSQRTTAARRTHQRATDARERAVIAKRRELAATALADGTRDADVIRTRRGPSASAKPARKRRAAVR
jgi:hypothetical protein